MTMAPNAMLKLDLSRLVQSYPRPEEARKRVQRKIGKILKMTQNDLANLNIFTINSFLRDYEDLEAETQLRLNIYSKLKWLETLIFSCLPGGGGKIRIPSKPEPGIMGGEINQLFMKYVRVHFSLKLREALNEALDTAYQTVSVIDPKTLSESFLEILAIGGLFRDFFPNLYAPQLDDILSLALLELSLIHI